MYSITTLVSSLRISQTLMHKNIFSLSVSLSYMHAVTANGTTLTAKYNSIAWGNKSGKLSEHF